MALALAQTEQQPILDLNTTPLIDVMLVLLIMFIITIPVQTHAVKFDVPVCGNCPVKNEIRITGRGAILFNGVDVGEAGTPL
jgi:biopolymer transport protein ExbD